MFAVDWSPEQWTVVLSVLVSAVGGQVAVIVKLFRNEQRSELKADTLADKVATQTAIVQTTHDGLSEKVDDLARLTRVILVKISGLEERIEVVEGNTHHTTETEKPK